LSGAGHVDGASGHDRQQYLGLTVAQHLNYRLGVYMMNCAHPSVTCFVYAVYCFLAVLFA
jgi:hypothetical protein